VGKLAKRVGCRVGAKNQLKRIEFSLQEKWGGNLLERSGREKVKKGGGGLGAPYNL